MKKRASQAGVGIVDVEAAPPRFVMFVEASDGTFNVFEDDLDALKKYRAKRGERTSIHRAFVRRSA